MNSERPKAAILLVRISDDKADDAAGVRRQEADGRKLAERLGWTIAEVIVENDVSGYKRRRIQLSGARTALRTVRPEFRRALDLLDSGACDGLLAYDLDRVARDPRDLEDLIDVVEARTPRLPVESVTGSLRLANDADVTMARNMVSYANKSSRDTSRRVARKHVELAELGKPGGGGIRAFGYEKDGITIKPGEADAVRFMAGQVLDGKSLYAVAAELNSRRIKPVRGGEWNTRSVKTILTGPRITGLRRFRGEVVGEAVWPAILDRDVWEDVCAVLAARGSGGSNQFKRWLTGCLRCSLCKRPLWGWSGAGTTRGHRYWCATPKGGCGKIVIDGGHAEEEVERRLLALLAKPRVLEQLRAAASAGDRAADVRAGLSDDEQQLKELASMWARREVTLIEYREARKVIEARLRDARALLTATAPRMLRQLLADDLEAAWRDLEPRSRREVVMTLWPNGFEVAPHPDGIRAQFVPMRITSV